MLNNTNTCLYQAYTKITTYHHKICVSTKYQHVPQPVPSTMYHNLYHNKCINHAPTPVPNRASTMHLNLYQTMHQQCISTPYHVPTMHINYVHQPCTISCIIPCPNYAHKPCASILYINTIPCTNPVPYHVSTMHHNKCLNHIPYHAIHHMPINQDMNQQCISTSRPQPTYTMYPMMCLKSYTKALKHMPQACSSISPICNLITQYTIPNQIPTNQECTTNNVSYDHQDVPYINKTCLSSMYHTITKHNIQSHKCNS
jgi:hypothetical protein